MAQTGTKPVKVFRARGIHASVFANRVTSNGGEFTMHKVNLQRVFKDGDEFKHVSNFGRDEIPIARMLLERAYEFIVEQEEAAKCNQKEEM